MDGYWIDGNVFGIVDFFSEFSYSRFSSSFNSPKHFISISYSQYCMWSISCGGSEYCLSRIALVRINLSIDTHIKRYA